MRIISDFHDYYDCGQKLDMDKQTLYIRKTEEENFDWAFPIINGWNHKSCSPQYELIVIGFCGRLYPIIKLEEDNYFNTAYCYTLEQVDTFVQKYYKKNAVAQYFESPYRQPIPIINRVEFDGFFKQWQLNFFKFNNLYANLFANKRCPIFVINHRNPYNSRIQYNACLKPFNFAKVFDPMTAYQEINMFMNNMAVPIKSIPEINDVTMAKVKGFDKYSFRKDPIKKRKKK